MLITTTWLAMRSQMLTTLCLHYYCRAYDILKAHIAMDSTILDTLCMDGPYDTGLWRLSTRPDKPHGISDEVMSAFITVSTPLE